MPDSRGCTIVGSPPPPGRRRCAAIARRPTARSAGSRVPRARSAGARRARDVAPRLRGPPSRGTGSRLPASGGTRRRRPRARRPGRNGHRGATSRRVRRDCSTRPAPSPARNAAPSPVVSRISGRSTGTPSWSACNWHSSPLAAAPPSTVSCGSESPASAVITSTTSRTSNATASSVARTRWARVVPRVSPRMVPRAAGSQCGAPRPVRAGTKTTPPESGTDAARGSVSSAELIRPSPSRSHCTAAPVTKIAPSRA